MQSIHKLIEVLSDRGRRKLCLERVYRHLSREDLLVEAYAKEQGLWHDPSAEPRFSERLELDLGSVEPSLAGPKRPQDRIALKEAKSAFRNAVRDYAGSDFEEETGYDEAST